MTRTALFPKPIIAIGLSLALLTTAAPGFTAESDGIQWVHSLEAAKTQAKAENKLIFMDVYAEWCGPCKIMARDTFPDPTVIKALENYVSVKIDADKAPEITRQYRIPGVPTLFVLTADGAPLHQESGSLPPEGILALLETAKVRLEKITALEKEVHMAPDNVSKAVELARMYTDTGRAADAVSRLRKHQSVDIADRETAVLFDLRAKALDGVARRLVEADLYPRLHQAEIFAVLAPLVGVVAGAVLGIGDAALGDRVRKQEFRRPARVVAH